MKNSIQNSEYILNIKYTAPTVHVTCCRQDKTYQIHKIKYIAQQKSILNIYYIKFLLQNKLFRCLVSCDKFTIMTISWTRRIEETRIGEEQIRVGKNSTESRRTEMDQTCNWHKEEQTKSDNREE